ncbi:MAG: ATP-binding cassette domain-containing protein, partial [Deltaproteobacteria bacterium]|nr:ATP-binding cassette domain-containing protein [Deltaproteobacteria bacterium]
MEDLLSVNSLDFFYGDNHALKDVTLPIRKNKITSLIGPSGCGKTTLLRCFNRMHDLYPNNRYQGEILMDGQNLLGDQVDVIKLRNYM